MSLTSIAFLLAFFGGCALAFVRHPIYGLITYVAVFYLHPPSRWWGASLPDLRWALLAAAVTTAALLINRKTRPAAGMPLSRHSVLIGILLFLVWLVAQLAWVLSLELQIDLLVLYAKYALLLALIYKCIESEKHLLMFLWTHVAGCAYLGWLAYTTYRGGRFEGFGGPGINEANAAALQIVTGILVGASLFVAGKLRERAVLTGMLPFIVNALITSISRSAFLAAAVGGVLFNVFAPLRSRRFVVILSVLGFILFFLLANPVYWSRMATLQHAGESMEGVDTGASRLVLIDAQRRMFEEHPLGCGHRCTAILSPRFLDEMYLTRFGQRSSHNTFMTMAVEHGVPGMLFYLALLGWLFKNVIRVGREFRRQEGILSSIYPAVVASLGAVTVADMFVDYLKLEARIWFIGVLMVLVRMSTDNREPAALTDSIEASKATMPANR